MLKPLPVKRYLKAFAAQGVEAHVLLAGTGIDSEATESAAYLVELDQYRQIFENMGRVDDSRGLGLDIGLATGIDDFGPLGHAASFCRSARHSMEAFWPRYGEMFGLMSCPVFSSDQGRLTMVDFVTPTLTEPAARFCVEEALGQLFGVGAQLAGGRPVFENLELAYAQPAYHERYSQLFRCPVQFGSGRSRATINRSWLEKPLPARNSQITDFYLQNLRRLQRQIEDQAPIVSRVRTLLLRSGWGVPSVADVANELALSERTLGRRLQEAGVSYRKLVEEFRLKLAIVLIDSGQTSAVEISARLGYRDVNAFRRAFKALTGRTLGQYAGTD